MHRPAETLKYIPLGGGARGGSGGARGGGGGARGDGGARGGGGFEHTRQPAATPEVSEVHVIDPAPNV